MRKAIKYIFKILIILMPAKAIEFINRVNTKLYTAYVVSQLGSIGDDPYIESPAYFYNHKYIKIGNRFRALAGLRIEPITSYNGKVYEPQISIGDNVTFNNYCHLGCIDKLIIGNNVLIASKVFITDHYHGGTSERELNIVPEKRDLMSKGPVIINDDVWIGEGVTILSGVTIGKGSVLGAHSVVTSDVPPCSVMVGIPARKIR